MIRNAGADPATNYYQVTFSNTVPLSPTPRMLYVNADGNLVLTDSSNTTATFAVIAGQVLPVRPYIVRTTTTANVVALY